MITRIEYQSEDGRRSATVLWLSERRWHVTRRVHTTRPDCITQTFAALAVRGAGTVRASHVLFDRGGA